MTGNKDHLDDFEECKGGSVTFGGSKGYITEVTNSAAVRHTTLKVRPRKYSEILAFRREFDELAPKHLREVPKNKATSTTSVNSDSGPVNTQHADQDDSDMPELTIFNKPQKGIFDEASYELRGFVTMIQQLPIDVAISPFPYSLDTQTFTHKVNLLGGSLKSSVQTRSRGRNSQEHMHFWVEAMQEELLQFRLQQVWILVDLPHGAKMKKVFVSQPPGFVGDLESFLKKVFKGQEGYHAGSSDFQMSSMGELIFFLGLQVKQKTYGIFISQDKYVANMLKKFDLASVKTAITQFGDYDGVDKKMRIVIRGCTLIQDPWLLPRLHTFNAMKRSLISSDYAGANLDRKSTTGGCQFLRSRLISWQCEKQIIVATSTTEAEYVAAASCHGQVLWIQNQMLDYGFNFMNTKIHIDNESTICIVKNPVYHSKTKHIEIRHHFIRDSYEKKLIRVEKIHTDFNVADLLTKGFWDGSRFNSY
ncbi:hypothetical protein Tco_0540416 [Tanacetum coccineum]